MSTHVVLPLNAGPAGPNAKARVVAVAGPGWSIEAAITGEVPNAAAVVDQLRSGLLRTLGASD